MIFGENLYHIYLLIMHNYMQWSLIKQVNLDTRRWNHIFAVVSRISSNVMACITQGTNVQVDDLEWTMIHIK